MAITRGTISLKDLFVNAENFMTAFDKTGDLPASYSTGKLIEVSKKGNKFYLWNGHHRIADEINKYNELDEILNLQFNAKIYSSGFRKNYEKDFVSAGEWVKENIVC